MICEIYLVSKIIPIIIAYAWTYAQSDTPYSWTYSQCFASYCAYSFALLALDCLHVKCTLGYENLRKTKEQPFGFMELWGQKRSGSRVANKMWISG